MVTEAILVKVAKEDEKRHKEQERERFKKDRGGLQSKLKG